MTINTEPGRKGYQALGESSATCYHLRGSAGVTKSSKKRPRARAVLNTDRLKPRLIKGLQITPSAGGYIVYDSRSERVHYLNHTAGLVMDLCTGKNSWAEIVALVAEAYGLPRKPGRQVGALLRQLEGEGLISLAP